MVYLSTLTYCDEWHYLDDYDDMHNSLGDFGEYIHDVVAVNVHLDHSTGDMSFSVHVKPRRESRSPWSVEDERWKRLEVTVPSNFRCAYDKEDQS